jgi:hypothetical protein
VFDERGQPVPSFWIGIETFVPNDGSNEVLPGGRPRRFEDPAGAFVLDGLEPGRYVLTASADGRPPARSSAVDVEAGALSRHVRITLPRGAMLVGSVVDATTRKPLAEATVSLDAMTYAGVGASGNVTTDASGNFQMPVLPSGPFSVRVQRDGYRSKIATLDARGTSSVQESFELKPLGAEGEPGLELGGIGATLAPSPSGVIVGAVFEGGPGARAGLRRGDRIERIDGVSTEGFTVPDCVQRLRGPGGSRVSMRLIRDGAPIELTILRENFVR